MRKALTLVVICTIAILAGSSPRAQQPQSAFADIRVDLPLTVQTWITAVARLAASERRPLGVEFLPEGRALGGSSPAGTQLVLTGLDVERGVSLLIQHDRRYVADKTGAILNVRPATSLNMRDDFLNRPVADFNVADRPLLEVLDEVHHALDPSYPVVKRALHGLAAMDKTNPSRAKEIRSGLDKPITVALKNATVRTLLNAIALTHGAILWHVTYERKFGAYDESRITFIGFDNWTVSRRAKPRIDSRRGF